MASTVRLLQAITVVVCGAGLLCACGLGGGYKPPPPPPNIPETSISATRLHFEAAAGTESPVQQVTLSNLGSEPLGIVRGTILFGSKPFAMETTCGKVLAPAATCSFHITFRPKAPGFASGTLLIEMEDHEMHRVHLEGTSMPAPSAAPSQQP